MTNWELVERVLDYHHHKPDLQAARVVYSAVAAHELTGVPVWLINIAPPGSMKTELIDGLKSERKFHSVDKITPATFISGQLEDPKKGRNNCSPSLLHRIGPTGIVGFPDFSTILSMRDESRESVFADLRRIYDGEIHKEFGSAERMKERTWTGKLTFTTACTDIIDSYYSMFQSLGERFLLVRSARPDGEAAAMSAMAQDTASCKADLRDAVHQLFEGIGEADPKVSGQDSQRIAALAEFTVLSRTHVPRSNYNKGIVYIPRPEAPTRLAQQLAQLAKGSALIGGRVEVNDEDMAIVKRVSLDCISATRRKLLTGLLDLQDCEDIDLPKSTKYYAAEELEGLGLLETRKKEKYLSGMAIGLLARTRMFT